MKKGKVSVVEVKVNLCVEKLVLYLLIFLAGILNL
jgi:hypothetical protein